MILPTRVLQFTYDKVAKQRVFVSMIMCLCMYNEYACECVCVIVNMHKLNIQLVDAVFGRYRLICCGMWLIWIGSASVLLSVKFPKSISMMEIGMLLSLALLSWV